VTLNFFSLETVAHRVAETVALPPPPMEERDLPNETISKQDTKSIFVDRKVAKGWFYFILDICVINKFFSKLLFNRTDMDQERRICNFVINSPNAD
jgi:hypothetical protein